MHFCAFYSICTLSSCLSSLNISFVVFFYSRIYYSQRNLKLIGLKKDFSINMTFFTFIITTENKKNNYFYKGNGSDGGGGGGGTILMAKSCLQKLKY